MLTEEPPHLINCVVKNFVVIVITIIVFNITVQHYYITDLTLFSDLTRVPPAKSAILVELECRQI